MNNQEIQVVCAYVEKQLDGLNQYNSFVDDLYNQLRVTKTMLSTMIATGIMDRKIFDAMLEEGQKQIKLDKENQND